MRDKLIPYPEYKDSGLPWLGRVPAHWEIRRLKTILREVDRRSANGLETLLSMSRQRGLIPYSDMTDKIHSARTLVGYKVCRSGEIVMNRMQAWSGMFHVSSMNGLVSPDYAVFTPLSDANPVFLGYLLRSPRMVSKFRAESKGIGSGFLRLYGDQLGAIHAPLPPTTEQRKIEYFITSFARNVQRFICHRRRLIEVFNEQKQAIINRAVTRGLDPDVSLKPSGIDWLDDIPTHWNAMRLRNMAELRVSNVDKHKKEGEHPVRICNYTDVYKNKVITADMPFMAATASRDEIERFRLHVGDVIITKDSEDWQDIGVPALVAETSGDLVCGYHLAILKPRPNVSGGRFLSYALQCTGVVAQLSLAAKGVTRYGLSHGTIKTISLPAPPVEEQETIAQYIDEATGSLEEAVARVTREIDLIREYRTRLISDVVTGKVDVRHLAPPPGSEDLKDMVEELEALEEDIADAVIDDEEPINDAD